MSAADLARRDRIFYTSMSIIATLVVFVGFAPSFFLAAANPSAKPLALIYHIHGAVFTLFMLFFINQNLLIARGKPETHKRLGMFGAALGCVIIVFAFVVTIHTGRHGFGGPLSALPDP
jgi:peptidoglycan/LPS O-acetylase OafA/YrhL